MDLSNQLAAMLQQRSAGTKAIATARVAMVLSADEGREIREFLCTNGYCIVSMPSISSS